MNSPTVPTRQTTQISTEIHRRRRNHQSDFAIRREDTLLHPTDHPFHPRFLGAAPPILEHPCAHERSECQRHKAGSEDRDHDGDGEFTKDPADQAGHEDKRDEHRRERNGH